MKYITIGRQYGSGGRQIGKILSEKLNIPVYDTELITLASQKSGISAEYIEALDEQGTASFFHFLLINSSPIGSVIPNYYNMTTNDQLFFLQSDIIKELAKKGDCIFVGRCADYILEKQDILNVFIYAPLEYRAKVIAKRYNVSEDEALSRAQKIDRKRKAYYNHYTSKKWGEVESYHLSLDAARLGQEKIIDIIIKAFKD